MIDVQIAISNFFEKVADGKIEIYNECSLQNELGIFLRASTVSEGYRVQFEGSVQESVRAPDFSGV